MTRSTKKLPVIDGNIMKKIKRGVKSIKTYARRAVIIPDMVGLTFHVHNGKKFIPVYIVDIMIGHKLGEYSLTRTFKGHNEG